MSIVEIVNQYDPTDIIRITYYADGNTKVIKSHTIRYIDYRTIDTHPQGLEAGITQVQKKYDKQKTI